MFGYKLESVKVIISLTPSVEFFFKNTTNTQKHFSKEKSLNKKLPKIWQCCSNEPTHIFIYENGKVFLICKTHFTSTAHCAFVTDVIDYKSGKKLDTSKILSIVK